MAHIRMHVDQANGELPMVCMRCGDPASVVKSKKLSWYPRWILVLILLGVPGLVIMVILALALRKSAWLQAPLCERHQGHWNMRGAVTWIGTILVVLICAGALFAFIALERRPRPGSADLSPLLCIGSLALFVVWLIVLAVMQSTQIRPDEITSTHILLNGVSDEFVQAVEDAEIERRVRLRQMQVEDEEERETRRPRSARRYDDETDVPPRPRGPASEGIEEDRPARPAPPSDAFEA
jgi:hypothetical protein